jgi:F-type H+-transporting ATPase subunit b
MRSAATLLLAVSLLLLGAGAVQAAGKGDELLAPRLDLGIWSIVVFVLLLLVLRKYAWNPMLEGLHQREENIRAAAEEAKRAREETERVSAEFKAKMDQAYAEIPKLLDQARKDAERVAEEMRAKAQADIQAERQRLHREIDLALEQALQEFNNHAAQLATLISAKAIQRSLSLEDHRRLVDDAMRELRETPQTT